MVKISRHDDRYKISNGEEYILFEREDALEVMDAVPKEKMLELQDKLFKWMFHNSESVCGCSMIDIDYLDGQINELFAEYGIVKMDE